MSSLQSILFEDVLEHLSLKDEDLVSNHPLRSFVHQVNGGESEEEEGGATGGYGLDFSRCAKWTTDELVELLLRHVETLNREGGEGGEKKEGGSQEEQEGEQEGKGEEGEQSQEPTSQEQGQTEEGQDSQESQGDGEQQSSNPPSGESSSSNVQGEGASSGSSANPEAQQDRFPITSLSFSGCFKLSNTITYLLSELDWSLTKLDISFCAKITSNGLTDLIKSPGLCENLTHFFFNSPGGHVSSESLHDLLQSLPLLTHLAIENNEWMVGREFDGVATTSLESLDVRNCTNFELSLFLRQCDPSIGETLRIVDLRGCSKLDSSALQTLATRCQGLVEVYVSGNFQTKAHSLVHVAETCKELQVLNMSGFRDFNDLVLRNLTTALNRKIQRLVFFNCATLSDEAIELLDCQEWSLKEMELTWSSGMSSSFMDGFEHWDQDADPYTKRKQGDNLVFVERLGRTKFD